MTIRSDDGDRTHACCATSSRATTALHPTCSWKRMESNHHLPGFNRPLYRRAALPSVAIVRTSGRRRSCSDHLIARSSDPSLAHPDSNRDLPLKRRVVFHTTSRPVTLLVDPPGLEPGARCASGSRSTIELRIECGADLAPPKRLREGEAGIDPGWHSGACLPGDNRKLYRSPGVSSGVRHREGMEGIEPSTGRLTNDCSTTELRSRVKGAAPEFHPGSNPHHRLERAVSCSC